jgi:hypothetical protein
MLVRLRNQRVLFSGQEVTRGMGEALTGEECRMV